MEIGGRESGRTVIMAVARYGAGECISKQIKFQRPNKEKSKNCTGRREFSKGRDAVKQFKLTVSVA